MPSFCLQANRKRRYRNKQHEVKAQAAFKTNLEYIVAENAKGTNPYVLVSMDDVLSRRCRRYQMIQDPSFNGTAVENHAHLGHSHASNAADGSGLRHVQGVTNFTDLSYEEFAAQYLMAPQAVPIDQRSKQRRRSRWILANLCSHHQLGEHHKCVCLHVHDLDAAVKTSCVRQSMQPRRQDNQSATSGAAQIDRLSAFHGMCRHLMQSATPDSCFVHWGVPAYNPLNKSVISSGEWHV